MFNLLHQGVRAACTECKGGDELEEFKEYAKCLAHTRLISVVVVYKF